MQEQEGQPEPQVEHTVVEQPSPGESPVAMPATEESKQTESASTPHRSKKKMILICVAIIVIGAAVAGYFLLGRKQPQPQTAQTTPVPKQEEKKTEPVVDAENQALLAKFTTPTTGETWLPAAKKLGNLGYVNGYTDSDVTYYEIGARGDKKIIMSVFIEMGSVVRLYEKSPDGKVVFVSKPDLLNTNEGDNTQYFAETVAKQVKIDTAIHYDSLTIPKSLDVGNGYAVTRPDYSSLGDPITADSASVARVKQYGQSSIVTSEHTDATTKLTSIGYYVQLPIGTRVAVQYNPLGLKLDDYKWERGVQSVKDDLAPMTRGCGTGVAITRAEALTDADVVEAGLSPAGQKVYEAKSNDYVLVNKAYDEFLEFYKDDTTSPYRNISKEEFVKQHAVIFFKDTNNDWFAYARRQLRPEGGCAKPVVYLYPTRPTVINVKVGADVKVSIPLYNPSSGWNALAFPNGSLVASSGLYDSLFWEGPGHGEYPSLTAGTVVKQSDVVATIRSQLLQQGLNSKETADFMEYWTDKIPTKPYVRLTWLNTAQMNTLAPLHITPEPDTLIRVFLDMEGYDQPPQLPTQDLNAVPRTGFTVVEWGGLSAGKLY